MQFRKLVGVLLALSVAVPSFGQQSLTSSSRQRPDASFRAAASRIDQVSGGTLRLVHLSTSGVPQIIVADVDKEAPIVGNAALAGTGSVATNASDYVRNNLTTILGVPAQAELRHLATIEVGNSWHSSFEIAYNSIPLRDRSIHLHTGMLNGKVMMLRSNIPTSQPNVSMASIADTRALEIAANAFSSENTIPYSITAVPTLVYANLPGPTDVTLVYETILSDGFHQWRYSIDATSGEILEKRDLVECDFSTDPLSATLPNTTIAQNPVIHEAANDAQLSAPLATLTGRVTAKVHLKAPTDTLTTIGLRTVYVTINGKNVVTDSLGYWSTTGSYPVTLTTQFNGPYFTVQRQDGASNGTITKTIASGSLDLLWDSTNSDAAERDAANAVSVAHDHVVALDAGLTKLNTQRITVKVNENSTCNAFYDPSSISLNFFAAGGGCVNTAQISDVVEHEFGHRVNHVRYATAGSHYMNDMTLNEGFADLSSNFLRDNPIIGQGFTGKNSTLRTSDNTKQWPKDISADAHMSGTIISGAVWDYRKIVGHDVAEREYNLCGYHTPDGTGFNDPNSLRDAFLEVLSAMLLVDDDNNNLVDGTPHAAALLKAFAMHNIGIQNYFDINVEPIADAAEAATSYPVKASVTYDGPVGAINPDSVMVHYSTDNGKTYSARTLTHASGSDFVGSIPALSPHSIVRYYISARTMYAGAGSAVFPLFTTQPFAFTIGYDSKYLDNCEQDKGWELTAAADPATAGFWTLDIPSGVAGEDTNHTHGGSTCYATSDAVTGGVVTLTTNMLDLSGMSDPVIRYWYFYSNDQGRNGGSPIFKSQLSVNGGTSWRALQTTNLSTKGWKPYVVRVRDITPTLNAQVKLRFIATDYVAPEQYPQMAAPSGTIAMAGIDDLEILDQAALSVASALGTSATAVYPNPARRGEVVTIAGGENANMQIKLINDLGQPVLQQSVEAGAPPRLRIPATLSAGLYQIIVSSGSTTERAKLIVW